MNAVDVVIVKYHSEGHMARVLPDLKSMSSLHHELLILDNSENRVTLTMAWNDLWRSGRSPFVAFLNPDICLSPDWDGRLVDCLTRHPHAAIAMGNRYIPDGGNPSQAWMSGLAERLGSSPSWKDLGQHLEGFYAVMVKRQVLESMHGFDERFRFYFQDSDLQLRCLTTLKLQTVQVNHCPIWHIGMASTREAMRRGELDREEELRHVDRVRAKLASGQLTAWHELSPENRASIRLDPTYNRLSRAGR